jgi:hypothetical protein
VNSFAECIAWIPFFESFHKLIADVAPSFLADDAIDRFISEDRHFVILQRNENDQSGSSASRSQA